MSLAGNRSHSPAPGLVSVWLAIGPFKSVLHITGAAQSLVIGGVALRERRQYCASKWENRLSENLLPVSKWMAVVADCNRIPAPYESHLLDITAHLRKLRCCFFEPINIRTSERMKKDADRITQELSTFIIAWSPVTFCTVFNNSFAELMQRRISDKQHWRSD